MNPDAGLPRYSFKRLAHVSRNIRILFVQQFLEGLVPIYALYPIMFGRVGGLSIEQIGFLFAIWSLAYLVSELPSGVLADYWSRKNVMILGGVARGFAFLIWLLSPTFTGYAVGFALWGFTIACSSGSSTAYLHSELTTEGKEHQFAKYLGRLKSMYWAGTLLGFLIAAILTLKHSTILLTISIASSFIYSAVLLFATEHPYERQDSYIKTLIAGFQEVMRSKKLRYLCTVMFSIYLIIGVLEELFPRLYAGLGLSDTIVALISAFCMSVVVLLLVKIERFVKFSYSKQVLIMSAALILLVTGVAIGKSYAAVLILMFNLVYQLFRPVFEHHIQDVAKGSERATIGSIPGLIGGLLGAGVFAILGKVSAITSERSAIAYYGIIWFFLMLILSAWGMKFSRKPAR